MPNFTIRVEAHFEAAHFLRSYHGAAEPLHGHSYKVLAELARVQSPLDNEDLSVDFVQATKDLAGVAGRLDYLCINDVPPFDRLSPTAENIAQWIHQELSAVVGKAGAKVRSVTVFEGPFSSVRYEP